MKNNDDKEFKPLPYVIGAFVIVIICVIFTFIEIHVNGVESALFKMPAATENYTSATNPSEVVADVTTIPQSPTEKATEISTKKATEKPTEKKTQVSTDNKASKAEEEKENSTESPTNEPKTEQPQNSIIYVPVPYDNSITQNQPIEVPDEQVVVEPSTVYVPIYTENDITLSQSVVYVQLNSTSSIEVVFPNGLSSSGVDWSLDNSKVVCFSSADFNTVTIVGKNSGTTTVYAKPKGYNVTLKCTVIVS